MPTYLSVHSFIYLSIYLFIYSFLVSSSIGFENFLFICRLHVLSLLLSSFLSYLMHCSIIINIYTLFISMCHRFSLFLPHLVSSFYFLYFIFLYFIYFQAESIRQDVGAGVKEKNEKKRMISELKSCLSMAVRSNKPAYDVHGLHIALLEGLGLKGEAFRHVLTLMRQQRNLYRSGPRSVPDANSSSFTRHRSTPEKKGFQYLFLSYFARFRPYSQKKRILSAALNWVREGPVDKNTMEMGENEFTLHRIFICFVFITSSYIGLFFLFEECFLLSLVIALYFPSSLLLSFAFIS
jgi:hypothetical protein